MRFSNPVRRHSWSSRTTGWRSTASSRS